MEKHFKQIVTEFPLINIALMPIGPTFKGENTQKEFHINAHEALDAFIDLQATTFIPMHYGTFFTSKETVIYPLKKLRTYWQKKHNQLINKTLLVAQCGKTYTFA